MKKLMKKTISAILFMAVIVVVFTYLYPEISSRISRRLDVRSSLSAHGYYYPLRMDQITALSVDSNIITINGYDVMFYRQSEPYRIERSFPEKYSQRDTSWMLLDSTITENGHTLRTFRQTNSMNEVSVALPFWNSSPEWVAMSSSSHETLIIISGANWKRSEDVYLGFIEIKH